VTDPLDTFRGCDASLVSDAMDEHGLDGVVTAPDAVGPVESTVVGRATPMRFERAPEADGDGDGRTNFPFAMLEALVPGRVAVLAGADPTAAVSYWGGQATALAAAEGVAGVVIDGGYRDAAAVRAGDLPVFGRRPTPRSGQGRVRVAATDAAVTVDGVRVGPEDVVVADETGIVVVPAAHETRVAETAATLRADESALASLVAGGAGVDEIRAAHDRF
jgi:regulator of RNase E activity RraA